MQDNDNKCAQSEHDSGERPGCGGEPSDQAGTQRTGG